MPSVKDMMNMSGRSALITGATGHLGSLVADTLAELGAELILVDREGADFENLEKNLHAKWNAKCTSFICDLENEAERNILIGKIHQRKKPIHCLVNNAAFVGTSELSGWIAPLNAQSLETWRRAIEVNLTAPFHLSRDLAPLLSDSRNGNIINIASIYGEYAPDWSLYEGLNMASPAAYASSKAGLIQLTRWLATTIAPDIRVNAISPGGIERGQNPEFIKRYKAKTPLGRMATENDFRGSVAYLASDLSLYVTGQLLRVDGGWGVW